MHRFVAAMYRRSRVYVHKRMAKYIRIGGILARFEGKLIRGTTLYTA